MIAIQNLAVVSTLIDFAKDAHVRSGQLRGTESAHVAAAQDSEHRRREIQAVQIANVARRRHTSPLEGVGALQTLGAVLGGGMLRKEIARELPGALPKTRKSQKTSASRRVVSAAASEAGAVCDGVNLSPELFAQTFNGSVRT